MGCRPSTPEVITVTPPDPPPSEVPSDPPLSKPRSYRPSIASLQIPNFQDDLSSECMSDRSTDQEAPENQDYLCGTDVSLQWLLQTFADKFNKNFEEEPQWITERLNRPKWMTGVRKGKGVRNVGYTSRVSSSEQSAPTPLHYPIAGKSDAYARYRGLGTLQDYATSTVLRVTFGWEDDDLPKSVILKTLSSKELRDDDEAKYHYLMFKRECNVYDWTQKYSKLASPRIFHIKRQAKDFGGVVVMEDIGERGVQQDAIKGLSVDGVRDLLRHLAVLHTVSMKHTGWNTLVADLPPSYYEYLVSSYNDMVNFFERHDVDHSRFVETGQYFSSEYLYTTSTEAAEKLPPKVFVHGEPYASNVFVLNDSKDSRIAALIDWTESHSGCFGEDIAKAICWNLSTKDRLECTTTLLEEYHLQFVAHSPEDSQITLDLVRKAFDMFVPLAMVTFVAKVIAMKNKEDIEPMIERAKGLIQNVYTMGRILHG
ncbi:hypothetical protein RB195_003105 [Necator americanus]|uniref:CHK kinase-like domain-containing protein n=1 Tax=Necator americanus TaxID=51031 RepID=A0ABR1DM22_NECAM